MSTGKQAERPRIIIIKKKGHAAHHGGAWKVAFADFAIAMMAFFMVLWLVSQTDTEAKQELSAYFRTGMFSGAPSLMMGGSGIAEKGYLDVAGQGVQKTERIGFELASKNVKGAVRSMTQSMAILSKNVRVDITKDGLLIQILDGGQGTLFDRSSAALKPPVIELLKQLAPILGQLPNKLQIHGHTDSRLFASGSVRDNWQLSFERADNARKVLAETGIPSSQMVGVFAHADSNPINVKDRFAPENRRLAILAIREGQEEIVQRGFDPLNPDKVENTKPERDAPKGEPAAQDAAAPTGEEAAPPASTGTDAE